MAESIGYVSPDIRIKNPWLLMGALDRFMRPPFEEAGNASLLDAPFINDKVDQYQKAWAAYEDRIMPALCDMLGLAFRQNTIDVYVVPFHYSFSDPLVLSTMLDDRKLVRTLAHELLHRLYTDNAAVPYETRLTERWQALFGTEHSFNTLVHIPVHAALKALLIDVLHEPEQYDADVAWAKDHEAYRLSWEYVDSHDYKEIIAALRKDYAEIQVPHA